MKYVPFNTIAIDDEFGTQMVTEYDESITYDTYKDAKYALYDSYMIDESNGEYGVFGLDENGEIAERYILSDDEDCDSYEDYGDIEMGFNPYMGCYDFDC